ncbi:hypothetical protein, partial [Bradyrhizobium sp. SUTN9-2]|uniref:hypothetical protein n=1 Tax=Bradyrhizobium sp. SUTN9-2 TaxID=1167456 RepID=UPI001FCE698E
MPLLRHEAVIKQLATTSAIIGLILGGCARTPSHTMTSVAWDGFSDDPNRSVVKRQTRQNPALANRGGNSNLEREKTLATLRPYSDAWWVVNDEIEAENDRQLNSKLA